MIDDYLELGPLIEARLRDAVPEIAKVASATSLAMLDERSAASPAVFVLYDGDTPSDGTAYFTDRNARLRWLTVLAVRNQRDTSGGSGTKEVAGPLITKIIAALKDWYPSPAYRKPQRASAPRPGYTAGFGYFPLAWEFDILNR